MTEQETGDNVAGEGSRALTLDHSARLAGGFRWVEQRLFEVMGKWSLTYPDPSVQIFLDTYSLRHGWHADLWRDRLPVMAGSDPDAWTRPLGATAALAHPQDGLLADRATTHVELLMLVFVSL